MPLKQQAAISNQLGGGADISSLSGKKAWVRSKLS